MTGVTSPILTTSQAWKITVGSNLEDSAVHLWNFGREEWPRSGPFRSNPRLVYIDTQPKTGLQNRFIDALMGYRVYPRRHCWVNSGQWTQPSGMGRFGDNTYSINRVKVFPESSRSRSDRRLAKPLMLSQRYVSSKRWGRRRRIANSVCSP